MGLFLKTAYFFAVCLFHVFFVFADVGYVCGLRFVN